MNFLHRYIRDKKEKIVQKKELSQMLKGSKSEIKRELGRKESGTKSDTVM